MCQSKDYVYGLINLVCVPGLILSALLVLDITFPCIKRQILTYFSLRHISVGSSFYCFYLIGVLQTN